MTTDERRSTYDVAGHLLARVRMGRGRLDVDGGPDGQVSAAVTALEPSDEDAVAAAEQATVELAGNQLTVEVPTGVHDFRAPAVHVVLVVPVGTDLRATGGDVDVTAPVALGDVRLRLGNGDVRLGDSAGTVDVKAGNVTLDAGDVGDLAVAAGNATVTAGAVGGAALRVGAGSLHLAASTDRVAARGGNVDLVIDSTASGAVDFRAAAGSATIGVAPGTDVQLDLVSAVGDVACTLPVEKEPPREGATLALRLHTGAGDLRVHRAGEEPPPAGRPAGHGFPDVGRIIEDAMSNVQVQLDRAGLSGIRVDATRSARSRPGWAEKLEKAVRKHAGTTRTRYVGPQWGDHGPVVSEQRTWLDGHRLPVDDAVTDAQVTQLRAAGYDGELVDRLPVDGPWSVDDLLTVCRAGLAEVVELVGQIPVDGPYSPAGLAALVADGLPEIVRRVQAATLDAPLDPDDVLPRFGSQAG